MVEHLITKIHNANNFASGWQYTVDHVLNEDNDKVAAHVHVRTKIKERLNLMGKASQDFTLKQMVFTCKCGYQRGLVEAIVNH